MLDGGNCLGMDPEKFLPSENETAKERAAKAICQGCPIRRPCLEYAIMTDSIGIWAGSNYSERQLMQVLMPDLKPAKLAESYRNGTKSPSRESDTQDVQSIGHIPRFPARLVVSIFHSEPSELTDPEFDIRYA